MFNNLKMTAAAVLVLAVSSLALANGAAAQPGKMQSREQGMHQKSAAHAHPAGSMSNDVRRNLESPFAASSCPALEGYPDCH
ncbi:MAG TPA: hypothetical protein VKW08_13080 [Xanthobacteraceae bacterium]|nr:hypothetical protein [Xanthobacteraceae bacterium]